MRLLALWNEKCIHSGVLMSPPGLSEVEGKRWSLAIRALLFFAAYLAGSFFGSRLLFAPYQAIAFWPPCGLMLGILLVSAPGEWIYFLLAALPASLLFEMFFRDRGAWLGLAFAFGNFANAAFGAWILRNTAGGVPSLERAGGVLRLVLVCAGLSAIGATFDLFFL